MYWSVSGLYYQTTRFYSSTFRWIDLTAVFIFRKSTFFNVLTKSQAAAENFPFCTIDPNESRVPIPDERYDFLCQFHKPARYGVSSFTYHYSHFRSVFSIGLLAIGMRKHMTMLLTRSCKFHMMYDCCSIPGFSVKEKCEACEPPTPGCHTHLWRLLKWAEFGFAVQYWWITSKTSLFD